MNPCIKTGCDVLIESHQAVLHGDLYVCGEMYVLRYIASGDFIYETDRIANAQVSFFNSACDHADHEMQWCTPDNLQLEGACVWIIHKDYVRLSDGLSAQIAAINAYRDYLIDKDDQFHD